MKDDEYLKVNVIKPKKKNETFEEGIRNIKNILKNLEVKDLREPKKSEIN